MNQPLVSIIIPTFNRAHLIAETLDSVFAQTYTNWECIIVDDGSMDNTDEVVGQYVLKDPRFQYHHRPKDRLKGANACRNYGFELAKGEYVNWFDDDDLMVNNKLQLQLCALETTEFHFSVCQTSVFEGASTNVLRLRHEKISSETPLCDFIQHKIAFLTQAPFFRVEFLKKKDLKFDENLQAAQEWEFICRLLYYSPDYHVQNIPLVLIRKHENSVTYNNKVDFREWNYYLARKKVFNFLKNKKDFHLKSEILNYLKKYFRIYFKSILFKKQPKKILSVFIKTIYPFNSFYQNIKSIAVLLIIILTAKGYRFRNSI